MKRAVLRLGFATVLVLIAAAPLMAQVGERPRDTDNTDDAEDRLEDAEDEDDEARRLEYLREALGFAEAEIAENANNPLGYRLAALASLGLEEYEQAGEYFDRATELYPLYEFEDANLRERTWIDLYQEAMPLVNSGDYEGAAVIFEGAHAIYASRPEVMITLSQIYGSTGDLDRSLFFMDEVDAFWESDAALAADSATMAGWQDQASPLPDMRARVLSAAGRLDEAAEAFRALADAEPDNIDHVKNLAQTYMDMGDTEAGLAVYEELIASGGLTGQDYYAIGIGFYNANDYANAAAAFEGGANMNEFDRDAVEMWARSLQLDERMEEIPPVAQRWSELDPYGQNAYVMLAQAANQLGDTETTQSAMATVQDLEVNVDQLQFRPYGGGGGAVSGSVFNKTLEQGAAVTLRFTFYGTTGDPIGATTVTVEVGPAEMAAILNAEFDSAEQVGGYTYELTIG